MKLIRIEWIKLKGHRFFWIGMGLYLLAMVALIWRFGSISPMGPQGDDKTEGMIQLSSFADAGFYQLPFLWHNIAYISGYFKFIPAFLLIFFVANEFTYKTYRQNVIDGLSIRQFFTGKMILTVFFAFISLVILVLMGLAMGSDYNEDAGFTDFFRGTDYLLAFFLEVLFMMVFATVITLLVKRSAISIIVILVYYFILEPIIGWSIGEPFKYYLPTAPSRELILQPFTRLLGADEIVGTVSATSVNSTFMAVTFLYTLVFAFGGYLILKKRDL